MVQGGLGLDVPETAREQSFCAHAILAPREVMKVPDVKEDMRFLDNPLVTGEPGIRFYAGAPIVTADGTAIGTVCAIDTEPRTIDHRQAFALQALARTAASLFDLRGRVFAAEDALALKRA